MSTPMKKVETRPMFFLNGRPVELWENPEFTFDWTREGIEAYAENYNWVALFNVCLLVYHAYADVEPQ